MIYDNPLRNVHILDVCRSHDKTTYTFQLAQGHWPSDEDITNVLHKWALRKGKVTVKVLSERIKLFQLSYKA